MMENQQSRSIKMLVVQHPDPNVLTVHFDREVAGVNNAIFAMPLNSIEEGGSYNPSYNKLGDEGRKMLDKLAEIAGLEQVTLKRYTVILHKGQLFTWNKILDDLRAAVRQVFGVNRIYTSNKQ